VNSFSWKDLIILRGWKWSLVGLKIWSWSYRFKCSTR